MKFLNNLLQRRQWRKNVSGLYVDRGPVKFRDVAITYRMGAGFPGTVTRTHPASILPFLNDTSSPVLLYGQPVVLTTSNTGRMIGSSDTASLVVGIAVRPFPTQQRTGGDTGSTFGTGTPPPTTIQDYLSSGTILVQLNTGVTAPTRGLPIVIWIAATSGNHVQGGFETATSGGNTISLDSKSYYMGPPDANGVVEIAFNL